MQQLPSGPPQIFCRRAWAAYAIHALLNEQSSKALMASAAADPGLVCRALAALSLTRRAAMDVELRARQTTGLHQERCRRLQRPQMLVWWNAPRFHRS